MLISSFDLDLLFMAEGSANLLLVTDYSWSRVISPLLCFEKAAFRSDDGLAMISNLAGKSKGFPRSAVADLSFTFELRRLSVTSVSFFCSSSCPCCDIPAFSACDYSYLCSSVFKAFN